MKRGNLIIYDNSGQIWYQSGDAEGDILPHNFPEGLPYIQTHFGDLDGKRLMRVNVSSNPHKLVTEDIIIPKTNEQLRIEELETQLLLNEGVI